MLKRFRRDCLACFFGVDPALSAFVAALPEPAVANPGQRGGALT
jgi:hypothetical protein